MTWAGRKIEKAVEKGLAEDFSEGWQMLDLGAAQQSRKRHHAQETLVHPLVRGILQQAPEQVVLGFRQIQMPQQTAPMMTRKTKQGFSPDWTQQHRGVWRDGIAIYLNGTNGAAALTITVGM